MLCERDHVSFTRRKRDIHKRVATMYTKNPLKEKLHDEDIYIIQCSTINKDLDVLACDWAPYCTIKANVQPYFTYAAISYICSRILHMQPFLTYAAISYICSHILHISWNWELWEYHHGDIT